MVAVKKKFSYLPNGQVDFDAWIQHNTQKYTLPNKALIQKTVQLAQITSQGLTTFYGQPCIEQGLEMAEILLDLKLDADAIAASIINSSVNETYFPIDKVKELLGASVAKLVSGIKQTNILNTLQANNINKNRDSTQIDRLRQTFLAMASDIRVVIIKLAERLCIMRGIKNVHPEERKRLAQETLDIYAALANRLGIGQLKWELEDISFHYINPEAYKRIADFLAERRIDREKRIDEILLSLKKQFEKEKIKAIISGRAKHIYSIYLKAQKKQLDYPSIFDYSALRILVNTIDDCYTALSIVNSLWEQLPEEFDDYIAYPKPNGYRSIHTAVLDKDGKHFEIQIRTNEMHEEAEHGITAHWIYKEDKLHHDGYESKITLLRQLLAWHKELAEHDARPDKTFEEIFKDRIYVFTPTGDIIDLPAGSTPLDFAYRIHTDLGHHCRGAKINDHIVQLTYALRTGDQVDILTIKNGMPSRDWLQKEAGYIKTTHARRKIIQFFKHHDAANMKSDPALPVPPRPIYSDTPAKLVLPTHIKTTPPITSVKISGINDLLTRIAKCCKPIPGDGVIGYITQGQGVSIHRQDCNNITHLKPAHHDRLTQVEWNSNQSGSYFSDLKIHAHERENLLREITALVANLKINLVAMYSSLQKKNNLMTIVITVQINDKIQLKQLIHQISQLERVYEVKRNYLSR
ncbi:MAG: relA [Gammaproteobacteria bacterium]|jgi:GTP pyrophosphokinase|nr:relA [Gammaproteobacteria bacterium]